MDNEVAGWQAQDTQKKKSPVIPPSSVRGSVLTSTSKRNLLDQMSEQLDPCEVSYAGYMSIVSQASKTDQRLDYKAGGKVHR